MPRDLPLNSLGLSKAPADTRVVVAMSGGVDSSVVAAMLIALLSGDEEVAEGVRNLQPTFFDCCAPATPA